MNTQKLALWSLYSYASAIVFIVFTLYFSQWLVIDRGVSDLWFNVTYIISSVLLLVTAPVIASVVDRSGGSMKILRISTIATFIAFFATSLVASVFPDHFIIAAAFFTCAVWGYLFSAVFYSLLLADLSTPLQYGHATGWGQCSDWLGEISGVLIALPFVTGAVVLWGTAGRAQAFMPAAVLYLIFSLPMLVWYREQRTSSGFSIKLKEEYTYVIRDFFALMRVNGLGWFFLAFFFFNDAIITAASNFTIYLDRVYGVSDNTKSYLLLGILVSSAIGAFVAGRVVDRAGLKRSLIVILCGWMLILPALALSPTFGIFTVISVAMGIWFGAVWVVARGLTARLAPPQKLGSAFSYYILMERFSSLVGPLSWGLIVSFAPHAAGMNYRVAVLGMSIFVLLGLVVMRKVPSDSSLVHV